MKKTVKLQNMVLGQGETKICVPITLNEINQSKIDAEYIAEELCECVDMVEVRIDYYSGVKDTQKLTDALKGIKEILNDIPILCTFRSFKEGGEMSVSDEQYEKILMDCITCGEIDLLDLELFTERSLFEHILNAAHDKGIPVVVSSHDFSKTPEKDEIVGRLMLMERLGADIAKIAVMPRDREDVLILLSATSIANTCMDIPVITISMGKTGAISRVSGQLFGSCMTFGVGKKASAPGQIDAKKLKEIMNCL